MQLRKERRTMLRQFFPLLVAIALQQILALTVNLVDNFMLGRYSETAMSGAALVNQVQFIVQQLSAGIGVGVSVLGAQYWGKGQTEPIKRIIGVGLKFGLAAGLIFTVVTRLFPAQVIGLFTDDPVVLSEAVRYLRIMCWTYILFAASSLLVCSLQSVQTAFIGMIMSAMTIVINMALNYTFIFGNFGAPELGVQGAAVATLTSRSVELITILVYILCIDRKLKTRVKDLLRFDVSYLGDYVRVSLPVMLSGLMWGVAQAAQTAILGHISAETIAANAIASVCRIRHVFRQRRFGDDRENDRRRTDGSREAVYQDISGDLPDPRLVYGPADLHTEGRGRQFLSHFRGDAVTCPVFPYRAGRDHRGKRLRVSGRGRDHRRRRRSEIPGHRRQPVHVAVYHPAGVSLRLCIPIPASRDVHGAEERSDMEMHSQRHPVQPVQMGERPDAMSEKRKNRGFPRFFSV